MRCGYKQRDGSRRAAKLARRKERHGRGRLGRSHLSPTIRCRRPETLEEKKARLAHEERVKAERITFLDRAAAWLWNKLGKSAHVPSPQYATRREVRLNARAERLRAERECVRADRQRREKSK